jgi:hypothetical protein
MNAPVAPRLLLQYLEPSDAVDVADPSRLRDHLSMALDRLPVTDLALGWKLRPKVIEAVRSAIPTGVTVWRWVPIFVDSGTGHPTDRLLVVGPDGQPPPPFGDMADFRFLCLDHDEVVGRGLERATDLGREIQADGILLDRIRWHSPSPSPADELTCFCDRSRQRAARAGIDLARVASEVGEAADTLAGRRGLVAALLGRPTVGRVDDFLAWRTERVTHVVERLSSGLCEAGLRSALDVFTPAMAHSVGQDLAALAGLGEWSKSMTYFDALGPAAMSFELRGYAAWLTAGGEVDAAAFLADLLGFDPPDVLGSGPQADALEIEMSRLSASVGAERSVVGLDAVEIPGVCDVAASDLAERVEAIRATGLGLSPCWELLAISEERLGQIATSWASGNPTR